MALWWTNVLFPKYIQFGGIIISKEVCVVVVEIGFSLGQIIFSWVRLG